MEMKKKTSISLYVTACQKENESETAKRLAERAFVLLYGRNAVLVHQESGKPYFEGEDEIFVSISHGDGLCIAAISDGEIGVDTELMKEDESRFFRVANRYFAPDEAEYAAACPNPRFYEVWCKKESYVKYTGRGISSGFSKFSVLNGEGIEENVRFSHLIYENHMLALCSDGEFHDRPKYIEIN